MHTELVGTRIVLFPYRHVAGRVWELAQSLTVFDAAYVAVAEMAEAPLLTLDRRLERAPGIRCQVLAYAQTN
jgi:predicted nucleic acid-binding protein